VAYKTEIGTLQLTAAPVQAAYDEYEKKSLCLIKTVYPVIGEPPSPAGAAQVIVTSVPEITVIGAPGGSGSSGSTAPLPVPDSGEGPIAFVAIT
jgi:hypothetical protein